MALPFFPSVLYYSSIFLTEICLSFFSPVLSYLLLTDTPDLWLSILSLVPFFCCLLMLLIFYCNSFYHFLRHFIFFHVIDWFVVISPFTIFFDFIVFFFFQVLLATVSPSFWSEFGEDIKILIQICHFLVYSYLVWWRESIAVMRYWVKII